MRSCAFILVLLAAIPAAFSADEIDPSTGLATTTVVRPLRDPAAPPLPGTQPALPPPADAGFGPMPPGALGVRPHIALILPIASPALGPVADALRQGFIAASESGAKGPLPVVLMNVSDDGAAMLEACRRAHAAGARLVVAAITRDGATAIAKSDCPRVPVLTLNQPAGALDPRTGEAPVNLYSISLSLEQEAQQAAHNAVADGWRSAVLISTDTPLSRRVLEAFEREWTNAAGEIGGRVVVSGRPEEAGIVKDRIERMRGGDVVFVALDQPAARAVRPYISGMLPVYGTSMSVDPRADPTVNVDLQGLRYGEMPWFVHPDHPAVMIYPPPRTPMSVEQERLYALGIDAYRLANVLVAGPAKGVTLDGVTGRISLENAHQFARALTPAEVNAGRVVPIATTQQP